MQILVRDPNDPLTLLDPGQSGGLNVIDLANLYSCAFIATGDLGRAMQPLWGVLALSVALGGAPHDGLEAGENLGQVDDLHLHHLLAAEGE